MISERVIRVAKATGYGYLLGALGSVCAVVILATVCLAAGVQSFTLALGPIPFMHEWSGSSSWGFESGWGIGIGGFVGALIGLVVAMRRPFDGPQPI